MPTNYRAYQPEQSYLLPPSPSDWLPEKHLAFFISEVVDELDLSAFYEPHEESDERGNQPFHPAMMVKILIYAYTTGTFSSRRIAQKIEEDVAFRVLGAGNFPKHRTICDFRHEHLQKFIELFKQVVKIARDSGLIKLGRVAIDGTKVKANASKHKAMSYDRMKQDEKRLENEITELIKQAERTDRKEDQEYGSDQRGDELPEELQRRESRLKKIREAKKRLEERQAEEDREKGRYEGDEGRPNGKKGQPFKKEFGQPREKAQDNFTDPESGIMKMGNGFEQSYNAQACVDEANQIIVAVEVSNCAADSTQLIPMVEAIESNVDELPVQVLADSGYRSEANFKQLESKNVDGVIALGREGKADTAPISESNPATQRMKEKLKTERGAAAYRRRKVIVEPVFGWIKSVLGFRQFSFRGLKKTNAEWHLVCLAMNLRRLSGEAQPLAPKHRRTSHPSFYGNDVRSDTIDRRDSPTSLSSLPSISPTPNPMNCLCLRFCRAGSSSASSRASSPPFPISSRSGRLLRRRSLWRWTSVRNRSRACSFRSFANSMGCSVAGSPILALRCSSSYPARDASRPSWPASANSPRRSRLRSWPTPLAVNSGVKTS